MEGVGGFGREFPCFFLHMKTGWGLEQDVQMCSYGQEDLVQRFAGELNAKKRRGLLLETELLEFP